MLNDILHGVLDILHDDSDGDNLQCCFFPFFQLWLDLFSDSACILQGKFSCDCILQGKMGCTQLAINVPVLPLRHMQPPKKTLAEG